MEVRTETFDVRGLEEPVTETFYRSHYGPVVKMDIDAGTAITLHAPFYKQEIGAEQGWQLFQESTSIEEFETAVELMWPSHNFYWTDTEGNIGYWHAGRFPEKPEGADRRLPLMGDGTQEWVRITDPNEMPRAINPEQGWLTNWNNKPMAGWPYAESDVHWGEGFRVQILMATMTVLAAGGDLTSAHMNTINQVAGYHNTGGMNFAADLIAAATAYVAANPGETEVAEALGHLGAWATATPLPVSYVDFESPVWPDDESPTYDHAGLTIFNAWYDTIVPEVFAGILSSDMMGQVKRYPSLLIRVLRADESLNYPGYPSGAALDALIVDALKAAIDELKLAYGEDMSTWLTPVRMQTYDEQGALLAEYATHPYMNRGTYNHIAELSTPPQAQSVIPPGQSGFMELRIVGGKTPTPVPSDHAYDQVALYASWTYKDMLLARTAIEAVKTWERDFFFDV
jgi:penicillin amidase